MAVLDTSGKDWPAKLIAWVVISFAEQLLNLSAFTLPKKKCSRQFFVGETGSGL